MNADAAMRLHPCLHVSVESPSLVTQLNQQDVVAHAQEPDYSIATSNTHTEVNMSNNLMLAQLMKDMQDPEMMREAQAMMQSPEFQAHMRKMTENPNFKKAMQGTQELMKDPNKVAEMEAKVKAALADGEKKLAELEAARKAAAENGEDAKPAVEEEDDMEVPNLNIN
ncbi:hypothetical protein MHU86_19170 [Fragilaria crotonensis]|nr:hypothetical protein MHU86_19170 [Fragilaria crotonensis]